MSDDEKNKDKKRSQLKGNESRDKLWDNEIQKGEADKVDTDPKKDKRGEEKKKDDEKKKKDDEKK